MGASSSAADECRFSFRARQQQQQLDNWGDSGMVVASPLTDASTDVEIDDRNRNVHFSVHSLLNIWFLSFSDSSPLVTLQWSTLWLSKLYIESELFGLWFQLGGDQHGAIVSRDFSAVSQEKTGDHKVPFFYLFFSLIAICDLVAVLVRSWFSFFQKNNMQTVRRLAQNREAARKSRLRKKVSCYCQ